MTEPIPRVNWQCPKCLRKWSVLADRKAPALCRECAKLPASTAVRPNTQAGTPTTSGKRGIATETTATNEPQYRLWACPQCQKQWRVVQTRSKPAFCRDCGYRESASQVGAETNVHRQGSDRSSRNTRVPEASNPATPSVEGGQLLLTVIYAMAASSFTAAIQQPDFFPQPITPERWDEVFVATCLFCIGMLSRSNTMDSPEVRTAKRLGESLWSAANKRDPFITALVEDLVAFIGKCEQNTPPRVNSEGSVWIDSLRAWIGWSLLLRKPVGDRDCLFCLAVEGMATTGAMSALAAL
jgi:hypothetical protein